MMKILIPVDGSANAQRAVEHVIKSVATLKEMPQSANHQRLLSRTGHDRA
jgi:hypothetical protein